MYRICSLVPVFGSEARYGSANQLARPAEVAAENSSFRPPVESRRHPLIPVHEEGSSEPKRELLELFFLSNRG